MTPTEHTLAEVVGLTESVLGRKVVAIEADRRGASNAVYHVALIDGLACVVRISPREWRESVEAQVWAMGQCRSWGIPVPEVLTSDG
ncbi:MAG TPA: hypothetical protein VGW38_14090, partial [Chloroflexota bacterium]|nr:hypothetical protein [Chloroflexota bacterium]